MYFPKRDEKRFDTITLALVARDSVGKTDGQSASRLVIARTRHHGIASEDESPGWKQCFHCST